MKKILYCLSLTLLLYACKSTEIIPYFHDIDTQYTSHLISDSVSNYRSQILPDDELNITVSSVDPYLTAPYNIQASVMSPNLSPVTGTDPQSFAQKMMPSQALYNVSYLVDKAGEITFPSLGKVKVGFMSIEEATDALTKRLSETVKDPIVTVRIANFKVSILGEVHAPGSYFFSGQRVSLLDAIAAARDISLFGRRDNILLIRETGKGKEYFRFDITKAETLAADNFYLQQNDILYIEPNKQRKEETGYWQQRSFFVSTGLSALSIAISAASTAVYWILSFSDK